MPPGAHDVYGEEHLVSTLAQLICQHLDVPRWIFKVDNEFGGRGTAHLDVSTVPYYAELLREHDSDPSSWDAPDTQARLQKRLVRELMKVLPEKAVLNMRWLWKSWAEYVSAFKRVGGVIEASPLEIQASPSANLFIEPDGTLSLTSTHEQIFSSPFTFVGAAFPQTSVPFPALREATLAIGKACFDRGIVGHVGIDYVAFMDPDGLLRIWAVDLNIRVTHTAVMFGFFDFLVGGAFDGNTGLYYAPGGETGPPQQRCYVMNELFHHPQLPNIHHSAFFNMCRLKGVSFDLQERTGTVFNLMDSFAGGVLGVLTAGRSLLESLRKFADCLDFVQKQVGPDTSKASARSSEVSFKDVIRAIKQLVDKQVGGPKPTPPPPALRAPPATTKRSAKAEDAPQDEPSVSGQRMALPAPPTRYLQQGRGTRDPGDSGECA